MTRRIPRVVWWLLVPVVLVGVLWGAMTLLFPPARVRALVSDALAQGLRRDVRFADAGLSLWPPVRLVVSRPELAEPGGFGEGAAFAADRLALDLEVWPLLSRKVVVKRLSIDAPALHVVLRADGSTNLDSLGAPADPSKPAPAMDLDLREFVVKGGRVLIDDLRAARRTTLEVATRMTLAARGDGQQVSTSGTTTVAGLATGPLTAARAQDLSQAFAGLTFTLEHRGAFDGARQRLALEQLALAFGRTRLALSGVIDQPGPHARLDLRASGQRVDVAELLQWASQADAKALAGISGRGTLAFDVAVRGALPQRAGDALPALSGTIALREGAFRYAGAPVGVEQLRADVRLAPDTVVVEHVTAQVSGQPVRAQLTAYRFRDPLVRFAVQGDVDLAAIAPMLAAKGTELAGRAAVDVRGAGRAADPGTLQLQGQARLTGVRVRAEGLPKPVEGIAGTIEFADARAAVRGLTAKAGASSFTMDAQVTRPMALMATPGKVAPAGVRFDFRSPHLDLAELLPTTPGAPFLPNAEGGGEVRIARLKQGKLDVTDVAATVQLEPAVLASPSFSMKSYGGRVAGSARFDLRDTRQPAYAIKTQVESVQADELLAVWTPIKGLLRGTLSSDFDFSGQGQSPEDFKRSLTLVGLAAFVEGQLGPGPALEAVAEHVRIPSLKELKFKDLKLPLRIERGRVITDPVQISGPSGDWRLIGSVGFDGALDYAVSVTLPPAAVAALRAQSALAAGALQDDQGRLLLDLRVTGSAQKPRVAWDTGAMRDRLAGRASQAIEEQRAKLADEGRRLEQEARAAATRALTDRLGLSGDSARGNAGANLKSTADSLKKSAGDVLRGFFGSRGKPPATPAPAPTPAATDSVASDTSTSR